MTAPDLRSLRHFVAVAEELHFGRAAERLHMTQPPLSQSIQALEQELGVALFLRSKRSVSLTPVGAQWLPQVRKVLATAGELPELAARLASGELGSLRLSFVSSAVYGVLPALVNRFTSDFPAVELVLQEATSDVQIQGLMENEIDAGLVIAPPHRVFPPGLRYQPVWQEPLLLVLPEAYLTARPELAGAIDLRELADLPLILFPRESAPALHDLITAFCGGLGIEPRRGQRAIQMQTIIGLVSAGLGFALVPASLQTLQRPGIVYLPLAGQAPQVETGLVWHEIQAPPTVHHLARLAALLGGAAS